MGVLDTLPSGERRFCVGRWLGMAVLGADPPVKIDIGEQEDHARVLLEKQDAIGSEAVRKQIERMTNGALVDEQQESMETFLERLAATVDLAGSTDQIKRHSSALRQGIDTFVKTGHDPFADIVEAALEHATNLYGGYGFPAPQELRFVFSVARATSRAGVAAAVGGACRASGENIVVDAKLKQSPFWRPEMCSLLYVLLHELVVHAFAASHSIESPDGFAEGWMDTIAFELHETLTSPQSSRIAPLGEVLPLAQQYSCAQRLHVNRTADQPVLERCASAARSARMALVHADPNQGLAAMQAFSLALNRSKLDSSVRAEACETLGGRLESTNGGLREAAESEWADAANEVREASSPAEAIAKAETFALALADL